MSSDDRARVADFSVVIPARYASTRLPGKALADLGGKPMIQRTFEQACLSGAREVVIATDDERIADAARGFGAEVCMTSSEHSSGTERVADAAKQRGYASRHVVVNVQGDEPLTPPAVIAQTASCLLDAEDAVVGTLCEPIESAEALFDPSVVKVVCDAAGYALYFSRAPIPWHRDALAAIDGADRAGPGGRVSAAALAPVLAKGEYFRHMGLYAYRVDFLARVTAQAPCELEQVEALEQLRVLYHGGKIRVEVACEAPGPGIDTPADLEQVRALIERLGI